jgi:hypothetical protein
MSLKTLMLIKAVVCLVFGVLLGAAGLFAAREYAASLFGNLALTWYAKDAEKSKARRAIILDLFVYDAIGVVITIINVINGVLNPLGWGVVVVYLFFAIGYGYFWFAQKP